MVYSTSGHNLSQVNSVDTAAITALYVDSVAAFVERERRVLGLGVATGAPPSADVDPTSISQISQSDNEYPLTTSECSQVNSERSAGGQGSASSVQHDTDCLRTDGTIACDVELARIAIGLRQSAQYRLWAVLLQSTRNTGCHYLTRSELCTLLSHYGIKYTRHNLNRWLRAGQGVYWRLTTYGHIYLVSYENVSQSLIRQCDNPALPDLYDLVATNLPGMRRAMYIDMRSNNLEQFEAQCFAAWHASKECLPISRFTLQRLFNRDVKTLIRWQKLANVTVFHTFVHYTEDFSHDVPHHPEGGYRGGVIEYKVGKQRRWSAEYSNAYHTQPIRQHDKRGVSRRVFAISRNTVESIVPPSTMPQGSTAKRRRLGGLSRTGKYLYQDSKRAKGSAKFIEKPRAIWKGVDNRRCQHYEHSPDGRERMRVKACFNASLTLERREA